MTYLILKIQNPDGTRCSVFYLTTLFYWFLSHENMIFFATKTSSILGYSNLLAKEEVLEKMLRADFLGRFEVNSVELTRG